MKRTHCKVYYSLLAIAYLEVILWTTCLLTSCATLSAHTEDTGYLLRETENLRQTLSTFGEENRALPGFLDLRGGNLNSQAERASLLRLTANQPPPSLEARPINVFSNLFTAVKGVPAPWTSVKAIH